MRRRQDLGPPMSIAGFIKGFAFLIVLIGAFLALAWGAMSWMLGDCTPAIIALLILPLTLALLWLIGRSMPGWRD